MGQRALIVPGNVKFRSCHLGWFFPVPAPDWHCAGKGHCCGSLRHPEPPGSFEVLNDPLSATFQSRNHREVLASKASPIPS